MARGTLTESGYCVAETFHLLEEALRSDCEIGAILAAESVENAVARCVGRSSRIRVVLVSDEEFPSMAATESSQGVMALVRPRAWTLDQLYQGLPLVVVLDGLQDPGNAGAILRAAEAFGATGIVFVKGTVSPWNPKTVRASAGSLFRLPLVSGVEPAAVRLSLERERVACFATVPSGGETIQEADLTQPCAVVIGSEGRGVSETMRAGALELRIPTLGVESLNASIAAGVLLYEASRQRAAGRGVQA